MNKTVEGALVLWGLEEASWHLVAARENQVFRVEHGGVAYALRLHRPGYCSEDELRSELQWMDGARKGGLHVPAPIAAKSGAFLQKVGGHFVDVLTWVPGVPVGKTGEPLKVDDRLGLFQRIGREMARLHQISDAWPLPQGFSRRRWDRDGLLGEAPVWDRFWENATLSQEDRALFVRLRDVALEELQTFEETLDFGLIHADLVRENMLVDGDQLHLIDFDDSGFGFRLFDLATTLLRNRSEPDYPALQAALIEGYQQVREIDLAALDLFILLRSATYVGWTMSRMAEEGSAERNARFIATTRSLAQDYLAKKGGL